MSDRVGRLAVSLSRDMTSEDLQHVINAISMVRGVEGVEASVSDPETWAARDRVRTEVRDKLMALYKGLF